MYPQVLLNVLPPGFPDVVGRLEFPLRAYLCPAFTSSGFGLKFRSKIGGAQPSPISITCISTPRSRADTLSRLVAVQSTPLVSRDGRLGMISTHWRRVHQPAQRDLARLDLLARKAADVLESARK